MKRSKKTLRLALCSVFCAMGVVIMGIGALIEVMDLSMAVIASLFVIMAVLEMGGAYPWLIYAVTSVLSLLLLPNKTVAAVYLAFAGFYPILKSKFEKIPGLVCLVLKFAVFNSSVLVMYLIARALSLTFDFPFAWQIVLVILNLVFALYDFALTRLITAYIYVWRKKLKIEKLNLRGD